MNYHILYLLHQHSEHTRNSGHLMCFERNDINEEQTERGITNEKVRKGKGTCCIKHKFVKH
jgi:hypothetical protein